MSSTSPNSSPGRGPAVTDPALTSSGFRTLAEQAAAYLRDRIVRGELAGGQRLVETEIASQLGISRIPVREAFHQLAGEGLLEHMPNRGVVVTRMSPEELGEFAELCRLIERHLLEQAVPRLRESHLGEARHWVEQMELVTDPVTWFQVNWQFHSALYSAANRPLQLSEVRSLRARADRYIALLVTAAEHRRQLNGEHREILAACEARDTAVAVRAIDRHLDGGRRTVNRILGEGAERAEGPVG